MTGIADCRSIDQVTGNASNDGASVHASSTAGGNRAQCAAANRRMPAFESYCKKCGYGNDRRD